MSDLQSVIELTATMHRKDPLYSGNSEWERHVAGDELVMVLEGRTTVVLRVHSVDERAPLGQQELVVVPAGVWHRFEDSQNLKVLTVTPQPTEHRLTVDD